MSRMFTRKRVLVGVALLGGATLVASFFRPSLTEVETAAASIGPLEVTLVEEGRMRTVDRYRIAAPVGGRLERIAFDEGDVVRKGDVLARIHPLPLDAPTRAQLEAQRAGAQSRLDAAQAAAHGAGIAAEQAAREVERRRGLAEAGALTLEVLEQYAQAARLRADEKAAAMASVATAEAEVDRARAALAESGNPSQPALVRAPGDGTILRVPERSERVVAPGEPLFEVGNPAALEVVAALLTKDAVRVHPGTRARLTDWGGDTLSATLRRVEPSAFTKLSALGVEEQRVNVVLDVDERPANLGDGYRVEVTLVVFEAASVLRVPASALFRLDEGWRVFVVEAGRARLRAVEVGEQGWGAVEIRAGLREGEEVVLFPPRALTDGDRVRVRSR